MLGSDDVTLLACFRMREIDFEKLDWFDFLKNLRACDSDILPEFQRLKNFHVSRDLVRVRDMCIVSKSVCAFQRPAADSADVQ